MVKHVRNNEYTIKSVTFSGVTYISSFLGMLNFLTCYVRVMYVICNKAVFNHRVIVKSGYRIEYCLFLCLISLQEKADTVIFMYNLEKSHLGL